MKNKEINRKPINGDIFVVNFVWLTPESMRLLISSCGMLPDIDKQKHTSPCHSAVCPILTWFPEAGSWIVISLAMLAAVGTQLSSLEHSVVTCLTSMLISLSFAQPLSFSFTLELNIGQIWISFDFWECFWEHIEWLNVSSILQKGACITHWKWYTGKQHVISLASGI